LSMAIDVRPGRVGRVTLPSLRPRNSMAFFALSTAMTAREIAGDV
jgi:hypothetical protein